jgi:hypothetical protein
VGKVVRLPSPEKKAGPVVKRTLASCGYESDFYSDPKTNLVHFIVTRKGEAEIVMWGQEPSMAAAERTALDWMSAFATRKSAIAG